MCSSAAENRFSPGQMSTMRAVFCLPFFVILIFLPQMGLPLVSSPPNCRNHWGLTATMESESLSWKPQASRPV